MFIPYLLVVALLLIAVGAAALGVYFLALPVFVLFLVAGGWVLAGRGTGEQLTRQSGTHEIPPSSEAAAPAPVDPAKPVGGTLGDATE